MTRPGDIYTPHEVPLVEEVEGEPFKYRVQSVSGRDWHTVDLTDRGGHGACACEFFHFTANPNFKRHGQYIPYAPGRVGVSECRHIQAAREHFHVTVTQPMLSRFRNGIPHP